MNTKLTLSIDKSLVAKMKKLSSLQGRSISGMVEAYFESLVNNNKNNPKTSISKKYKGMLKDNHRNYKEELSDLISEKHA